MKGRLEEIGSSDCRTVHGLSYGSLPLAELLLGEVVRYPFLSEMQGVWSLVGVSSSVE